MVPINKNIEDFIAYVVSTLNLWGVYVDLSPKEQVYTLSEEKGLACSGFFAETPHPRLAVAMGKNQSEWLGVLAHEFSHACQWRENSPLWNRLFDDWGQGREEAGEVLDRWINGEERSEDELDDIISRIRDIERDCEKRTVKIIQQFKLPFDVTEYTQKSNAYIYFYNNLKNTRRWYGAGEAPYQLPEVWQKAPLTFLSQNETPQPLKQAFAKHYGGPHATVAKTPVF